MAAAADNNNLLFGMHLHHHILYNELGIKKHSQLYRIRIILPSHISRIPVRFIYFISLNISHINSNAKERLYDNHSPDELDTTAD